MVEPIRLLAAALERLDLQRRQAGFLGNPEAGHAGVVGGFGVQPEKRGAGKGIEKIKHARKLSTAELLSNGDASIWHDPCANCSHRAFCHTPVMGPLLILSGLASKFTGMGIAIRKSLNLARSEPFESNNKVFTMKLSEKKGIIRLR